MFLGRLFGWLFLFVAVFTASAEAVAALSTGEYTSIATSDILTIITGISPQPTDAIAGQLLLWPAWVSIGLVGVLLIFLCRRKKYKSSFPLRN
ncbi:MAG: hypothetical protein IJ752_03345 [Alphaproteobacteria bacterium]|nr:hypothetical protein [Alphaproteobacteria bacterium]